LFLVEAMPGAEADYASGSDHCIFRSPSASQKLVKPFHWLHLVDRCSNADLRYCLVAWEVRRPDRSERRRYPGSDGASPYLHNFKGAK
jgi:hypothetical protein